MMNSLIVISWHTPWKCVRVLVGTTSIRLSEDNHVSWVTCTTSVECKTVIIAVLTVMSGMDPHMISGNTGFRVRMEVGKGTKARRHRAAPF
jgi:hypothetical protein